MTTITLHSPPPAPEIELKAGQFWLEKGTGAAYILASIESESKYALISLINGNRWGAPTFLEAVFYGANRKFSLITCPFTVNV